jgi:hypothetical protein
MFFSYLKELWFGECNVIFSDVLLGDLLSKLRRMVIYDGLESRLVMDVDDAFPASSPSHCLRRALESIVQFEVVLRIQTRCISYFK